MTTIINLDELSLLELLKFSKQNERAEHYIVGRNPNKDWHGDKPDDPKITLCIRMWRQDLDVLIEALEQMDALQEEGHERDLLI